MTREVVDRVELNVTRIPGVKLDWDCQWSAHGNSVWNPVPGVRRTSRTHSPASISASVFRCHLPGSGLFLSRLRRAGPVCGFKFPRAFSSNIYVLYALVVADGTLETFYVRC